MAGSLGVRAQGKSGQALEGRAPMTLDCSGRDGFAPTRLGWRVREPKLNKVAVWTYYRGARRDPGLDAGATTVAYVPEKGWFWYIPQHRDMVSVGVVAEGKYLTRGGVREPREIFNREIEQNGWIKEHLACGTQAGSYYLTSEFSWRSRYCAADGLLVAGDAFGFLDPVFSSGVMLALKSGSLAADAIKAAIDAQDFSAERFCEYGRTMREGIENMRKLVYAFYDRGLQLSQADQQGPRHGRPHHGLPLRRCQQGLFPALRCRCRNHRGPRTAPLRDAAVPGDGCRRDTSGSTV